MTTLSSNPKSATTSDRVFNFSAGPGCLPDEVVRQAQADLWNIDNSGIGVMEHSHRGPVVDRIWEETEQDCRDIAGIPDNYKVLFLTGGASTQCFMVPANLLPQGATADYLVTGKWAQDSFKEAKRYGNIRPAYSSESSNFDHVPTPDQIDYADDATYLQFTSNNTIMGTQYHQLPTPKNKDCYLVCDASSDIYSKPIDFTKYGLVYAGAQKNLGPAGTTIVIVREDLIEKPARELPTMLQYGKHAAKGSRLNTPPVFPVYVVGLVFKWIKAQGGLAPIAKHNEEKANLIYDVLDNSSFYKGHAQKDSRSLMNIMFKTPSEDLDAKFQAEAAANGMVNMAGHRSTGGMRASIYNAFPKAGCEALASFMKDFEAKNG